MKKIKQIVGSVMYYTHAFDPTILMALCTITKEQTNATKQKMKNVYQLLNYLAMHPDMTI